MGGPITIVPKTVVPVRARDVITEMKRAGFPLVDGEPFSSNARFMFNRGLEGGSNFFVLVETAGNKFRAFMMNPDESREAASLPYTKTIISLSEGFSLKGAKFLDKMLEAVQRESAKKPGNVYFIQMHFHLGKMGGIPFNTPNGMLDDGVSSFGSCAVNAAFAHTDYFAQTMHNNFKYSLFLSMEKALVSAGIIALPGVEATLPIHFREPWLPGEHTGPNPNPNGPHMLLIAESPELQREIQGKYLPGGYYKYAPSTHATKNMEEVLSEIKRDYGNRVLTVVAHPTCNNWLPEVGLLDRILYGEISIERGRALVKEYVQAVACFNQLVPEELVDFGKIREEVRSAFEGRNRHELNRRMGNIKEAEEFVRILLNKWGKYGTTPSKNTLNMAFAAEMAERFNTVKIFESDSHNQNRLYYFLFWDRLFYWIRQVSDFGKGHTRLWLPEEKNRKLTPQEFIRLFHDIKSGMEADAKLGAVIHSEMKGGVPAVSEERERMTLPQKLFDWVEKYLYYYATKQGIVLTSDTLRAILRKWKGDPMAVSSPNLLNSARGSAWWPK